MTTVLRHAAQLVGVAPSGTRSKRGAALRDPGLGSDGAIVLEGEVIAWVGRDADLPPLPPGATVVDVSGQVVLPGLVDSHTHLLFAGDRVGEFEQRLGGLTYQEITARGGGILSSVRSVRQATRAQLVELARPRLQRMLELGVTTVEVKSGYGLTCADELKCLEAVAELNSAGPFELVP